MSRLTDDPATDRPLDEPVANTGEPATLAEDELVPEDDAVIGRAFRWSLVFIVAIAALAAVVGFILSREEEAPPERVAETAAPEHVPEEVAEPPALPFADVAVPAGVAFVHHNGARGEKLLPETMGSGVALFDVDGDDDTDMVLVNGRPWPGDPGTASPTRLYLNDGTGAFTDATAAWGLNDLRVYGTGVAVADYDGDGHRDLFVAAVGPNVLLRNTGSGFVDVSGRAGVAGDPGEWSSSATFFDYDNDGDLDLFVCNYVRWSRDIDLEVDYRLTGVGRAYGPPDNYEGTFPYLYRNDGDGTFTDVSAEAGVEIVNPVTGVPVAKALALVPIDVDRDGWMDLFVANDTVKNFFFHNQGDGTFEETSELFGLAYGRAGEATGAMGVDAGHYRNDADLGFAIGNFANEMSSLYISQGEATLFADEAIGEGVGAPSRRMLSFGILFFDVDLDGRLDLLETNGHLESEIQSVDPSQTYRQPAQLFWNGGGVSRQTFVEVAADAMGDLGRPVVGRGSAVADLDGDGDQDVVVTVVGERPLVLRNDQSTGHHWLRVRLVGDGMNRDAIGARLELTAGGATQRRQVMPTRSYQSASELPVTFGLGETTTVDSLVVTWPDGSTQEVPVDGVDRLLVVEKS